MTLQLWLRKRYPARGFIIKAALPIAVHHVGRLSTMYLYRFSYSGKLEPAPGAEQPAHTYAMLPFAKPGSWYYSGLQSASGPKPTWVTSAQDYLLPRGTSHAAKASRGARGQGHTLQGSAAAQVDVSPQPTLAGEGHFHTAGSSSSSAPAGKALPGSGVGHWGWHLGRALRSRVGETGTVAAESKAVSILRQEQLLENSVRVCVSA